MNKRLITITIFFTLTICCYGQKSIYVGLGYPSLLNDGVIGYNNWIGLMEISASYMLFEKKGFSSSVFIDSPFYTENPFKELPNRKLFRNDIHVGVSGSYFIRNVILETVVGWTFTKYRIKFNETDVLNTTDNGFLLYPRLKYKFRNNNMVFLGYRHSIYLGDFKQNNPENTITGGYIFSFNITKK